MQIIPLAAVPSQSLTANLNNQTTQLNIYQRYSGLYMDVYVNDQLVIGGCICQNQNRIVRSAYLGFSGDLAFYDTQGSDDPDYTGFGSSPRYLLTYLLPSDLAGLNLVDN